MEVVAAVLISEDRVLACRRRPGRADAGKWEFPGGKIEDGEDPEAALERELTEELGLSVEVGELLDRSTTFVDGRPISLTCYFVNPLSEPQSSGSDHDQVSWFARERLVWLDWSAPDLPAMRRLALAET